MTGTRGRSRCCARGELRTRQVRDDTLIPGHVVERADQVLPRGPRARRGHQPAARRARRGAVGVRQRSTRGSTSSSDPTVTPTRVRARVAALAGGEQAGGQRARAGRAAARTRAAFRLAWRMRAVTPQIDLVQYFLDARDGRRAAAVQRPAVAERRSAARRGVLGDSKKISVTGSAGSFTARDLLRPPRHRDRRHEGRSDPDGRLPERVRSRSVADRHRRRHRQQLDRRRGRRCARLLRLHLRLLLQALRPARPRRRQHPDPQPGPPGAPHRRTCDATSTCSPTSS